MGNRPAQLHTLSRARNHPLTGYKRRNQSTLGITRYIIGHSLKVQADFSYHFYDRVAHAAGKLPGDGWEFRFQVELGL